KSIAFTVFGFDVYWYSLLIMAGVLIGMFISTKLTRRRGYNGEMIMDGLLWGIPLGIIGARLYYVVFNWSEFANDLGSVFTLRMTGLGIYGAVIGALIAAYIICKRKKVSFYDIADAIMPSMILAQALGRWGNYFNNELYGAVVESVSGQVLGDLALFPPAVFVNGEWHVALFLLESMWNLFVFAMLMLLWKKKPFLRGGATWLYVLLYCPMRAVLEGMRLPEYSLMIFNGTVRVSQVGSALLAIVGLIMIIRILKKGETEQVDVPACYQLPKQEEKKDV
ncbi:MAG: prolipoprotein diacylglyceryl transferase, partial [Clostridia bacterium]|nr:prolipoprotein diacylglyceryl transferase [Clostridia bacterium]